MKKILLLSTTLLIGLSLTACGSEDNSSSSKNSSNKNQAAKKKDTGIISLAKYKKIEIGSGMDKSGSTAKAIKSILGKPNSTTTSEENGQKNKTYTFNNLKNSFKANSVTVTLTNGHANAKGYTNLSLDKIKPLNSSKVKSIKKGASYDSIVSKLGQPSAETEAGSGMVAMKILMYVTSKDGESTSFTLMSNQLTTKTKTKLN
ncbi:DUF3862 domain-containing protein [Lactobacillus sp. S2-2]|uniref:DUF3862 domain-containing protein n=1 Tax=Lactobacillus sp. S2-2 TaxID=2692917 RepID=UPI001F454B7F|nr:DUF3862 domain-containing protein [Lactobacillus sp. S2-2]MCF6515528.1 DUF3862 domain-containing protein [Lactobacillus sp. S2-2]